MHYSSTNRRSHPVTFHEAVLQGQPDDGGVYFPTEIPRYSRSSIDELLSCDEAEIAFRVIRPFVDGAIADEALHTICAETVNFDFPLVEITSRISALELFHGPTMAFKDVGARFMSRCLRQFMRGADQKTVVIVATSGDTGGAVAAGFHGIDGVELVILYPKDGVSEVQELQLTRLGGNVTTLELHGSFDDCQNLAKRTLSDASLRSKCHLTSANSINIARWLPQQFYYFYALKQWDGGPPVFSVPSGNFGNLAAGMLAHGSGLPVEHFIAACNANDVVRRYLSTTMFEPHATIRTLSNAMDVGSPNNVARIMELYGNDLSRLQKELSATSISDEDTAATISKVYERTGYLLDPHGAVGYLSLDRYLITNKGKRGIFLETAHPVKFDSVAGITGFRIDEPPAVARLRERDRHCREVENDYDAVRDTVLDLI